MDPVSESWAHIFLKAATEDPCPRLSFESYPSVEDRGGLSWFFASQGFIVFPRRKPQLYLISIWQIINIDSESLARRLAVAPCACPAVCLGPLQQGGAAAPWAWSW